jgi:hypothetical protein
VFIVVTVYFVIDSVLELLDTPSYVTLFNRSDVLCDITRQLSRRATQILTSFPILGLLTAVMAPCTLQTHTFNVFFLVSSVLF